MKEKPPFEEVDGLMDLVKKAEDEVKPKDARVLLRHSGTEPKARLLIGKWATQIADVIKKHIGA